MNIEDLQERIETAGNRRKTYSGIISRIKGSEHLLIEGRNITKSNVLSCGTRLDDAVISIFQDLLEQTDRQYNKDIEILATASAVVRGLCGK